MTLSKKLIEKYNQRIKGTSITIINMIKKNKIILVFAFICQAICLTAQSIVQVSTYQNKINEYSEKKYNGTLSAISINKNKTILAVSDNNGRIALINIQSDSVMRIIKAHDSNCNKLLFTGNNRFLISKSDDENDAWSIIHGSFEKIFRIFSNEAEIKIWDTNNWNLIWTIKPTRGNFTQLKNDPTGNFLITINSFGDMEIWNLFSKEKESFLESVFVEKKKSGDLDLIDAGKDGRIVVVENQKTFFLFNYGNGKINILKSFAAENEDYIGSVMFNDDQSLLVSTENYKTDKYNIKKINVNDLKTVNLWEKNRNNNVAIPIIIGTISNEFICLIIESVYLIDIRNNKSRNYKIANSIYNQFSLIENDFFATVNLNDISLWKIQNDN